MNKFSHLRIDGFSDCHIQGIAIDAKREYVYYSFTTSLLKTDIQGNIIGSVKGIIGHLGCLAFNAADGRVYASLEYNDDAIGLGILKKLNRKDIFPNSFYVAVFDVDRIDHPDMDAEKDGIMTAVYLKEVGEDYRSDGHKYGCSGIDGVTFAPKPGCDTIDSLYIAYGIYSDTKRNDNDHQIILRYNTESLVKYAAVLNQDCLHTSGPDSADDRYFVYTGNTTYGIQNLEFDRDNKCLFAAVYKGKKLRFPNYLMYAVDLSAVPEYTKLKGLNEKGNLLPLKKLDFFKKRGSICGCNFPYGSTGMISLGDNIFLFSEEFRTEKGHGTDIYSYRLYNRNGFIKEEISL